MKKVLAVCGSPRVSGNTAFLLRTMVEDLVAAGGDAKFLMLSNLSIEDCNGCLICEETDCTGDCSINDDMQKTVIPELLSTDALILGTPSYFDLPSAQLKRFMDRTNMILSKLTNKSLALGIVVTGQSEIPSLKATCEAVRNYCRICHMKESRKSPILVIARDVGDASKNLEAIKSVKALGRNLAGIK